MVVQLDGGASPQVVPPVGPRHRDTRDVDGEWRPRPTDGCFYNLAPNFVYDCDFVPGLEQ